MRERELQQTVVDMCKLFGLLSYHTHDSRRSAKGFPDLVIVGPGGVLFRELKSKSGHLTPEQTTWLNALRDAGGDANVWYPSDLADGALQAQLQRIRRAGR